MSKVYSTWPNQLKILCFCLILAFQTGCAYQQKKLRIDHVTTFLSDKSLMNLEKTPDKESFRWVDSKLRQGFYRNIIIEPISFNNQIYQVNDFSEKLERALTSRIKKEMTLVGLKIDQRKTRKTLRVRSHVSSIESKTKGIGLRDLTISSALFSCVQALLGYRDSYVFLYLEMEIVDASTNEPLAAFVSKGSAIQSNNKEVKINDILKIMSDWIEQGMLEMNEMKRPELRTVSLF